jgi:hypothetical protein
MSRRARRARHYGVNVPKAVATRFAFSLAAVTAEVEIPLTT